MTLTLIDYVNGSLSLVFVIISVYIGIILILKYKQYQEITLLYVGITWIIMCEPWWPHSVSFVVSLITGSGLDIRTFYFLAVTFIPIGLLTWLKASLEFMNVKKQKTILILSAIIMGIFEIIFFIVLIVNPAIIATMLTDVDAVNHLFILLYFLVILGIFLITGILFAFNAMKTDLKKNKMKGRILLIAILVYTLGGIIDGAFEMGIGILVASRILLLLSSILFYFGFILPKWLENILIRE